MLPFRLSEHLIGCPGRALVSALYGPPTRNLTCETAKARHQVDGPSMRTEARSSFHRRPDPTTGGSLNEATTPGSIKSDFEVSLSIEHPVRGRSNVQVRRTKGGVT